MAGRGYAPVVLHRVVDGPKQTQLVILEVAVEKLVHLGEQVGVTPDEMIVLLNSGMDVRDLLDYVASKPARAA